MYRIDYEDMYSAAEILYCFMTISALINPECAIWDGRGIPETISHNGSEFISETEFCKKIVASDSVSVTCVASTDAADKRRVVLTLIPELGYMVLNFPQANGRLNEDEKKIIEILG